MRKHDGSKVDFADPNDKKLTVFREQFHDESEQKSTKTEAVYDLNENGDAVFKLDIDKNESWFSLKVF